MIQDPADTPPQALQPFSATFLQAAADAPLADPELWSVQERQTIARFLTVTASEQVRTMQGELWHVLINELWRGAASLPGLDLSAQALGLVGPLDDDEAVRDACASLARHLQSRLTQERWPEGPYGPGEEAFDQGLRGRGSAPVCRALAAHLISLYALPQPQERAGREPRSRVYAACPECGEAESQYAGGTRELGRRRTERAVRDSEPYVYWGAAASELAAEADPEPGQLEATGAARLHRKVAALWDPGVHSTTRLECKVCDHEGLALGFVLPWAGVSDQD